MHGEGLGTTLSIFFTNTTVESMSLRFSMRAPCPPGRKTSLPASSRKSPFSGVTAMVSVDGFCSEAHFVLYAEFLLHGGYCFGELGFEELAVVCRNSEVETYLAAFSEAAV